jgi:hypothetical protein
LRSALIDLAMSRHRDHQATKSEHIMSRSIPNEVKTHTRRFRTLAQVLQQISSLHRY